jgi:hypothetical protein
MSRGRFDQDFYDEQMRSQYAPVQIVNLPPRGARTEAQRRNDEFLREINRLAKTRGFVPGRKDRGASWRAAQGGARAELVAAGRAPAPVVRSPEEQAAQRRMARLRSTKNQVKNSGQSVKDAYKNYRKAVDAAKLAAYRQGVPFANLSKKFYKASDATVR